MRIVMKKRGCKEQFTSLVIVRINFTGLAPRMFFAVLLVGKSDPFVVIGTV